MNAPYESYLVRIWRDNGRGIWHVQLKHIASGQVQEFSSLEQVLQYWLEAQAAAYASKENTQFTGDSHK